MVLTPVRETRKSVRETWGRVFSRISIHSQPQGGNIPKAKNKRWSLKFFELLAGTEQKEYEPSIR